MALLRRGLAGEPVRILQENLGVNADGIFGLDTETSLLQFQTDNGISADGIAGPDTFTLMGLDELVLLEKPIRGNLVRRLQEGLGIDARDGLFVELHPLHDDVLALADVDHIALTSTGGHRARALRPQLDDPGVDQSIEVRTRHRGNLLG